MKLQELNHSLTPEALQDLNAAQKELVVNHSLKHAAQSLLDSSKEEIIQFVRGKAAVKKYK